MVFTIHQRDANVYHGTAGDETLLQGLGYTFFNARHILSGNHTSHDLILKEVGLFTAHQRLDLQPDIGELSVTAALLLVASFSLRLLGYSFAVRYSAIVLKDFDAITPLHAL